MNSFPGIFELFFILFRNTCFTEYLLVTAPFNVSCEMSKMSPQSLSIIYELLKKSRQSSHTNIHREFTDIRMITCHHLPFYRQKITKNSMFSLLNNTNNSADSFKFRDALFCNILDFGNSKSPTLDI